MTVRVMLTVFMTLSGRCFFSFDFFFRNRKNPFIVIIGLYRISAKKIPMISGEKSQNTRIIPEPSERKFIIRAYISMTAAAKISPSRNRLFLSFFISRCFLRRRALCSALSKTAAFRSAVCRSQALPC